MNWKLKYQDITSQLSRRMENVGMKVSFEPYDNLKNPELTCRLLMKLSVRLHEVIGD